MADDSNDLQIQKRIESFEKNIPEDQRNLHAKETFEDLTQRAAKPVQPNQGIQASSDGYIDTQTHSRKTEDTSD